MECLKALLWETDSFYRKLWNDVGIYSSSERFITYYLQKWGNYIEHAVFVKSMLGFRMCETLTCCSSYYVENEDGQDTSACKISGHSLHVFSGKCPETSPDGRTDGRTDGHAVKWSRLIGWTNGPMYRWKEGISCFGRTDGRTTRKHNASGA